MARKNGERQSCLGNWLLSGEVYRLSRLYGEVVSCDAFCGQTNPRPDQAPVDFREVRREWERNIACLGLSNKVSLFSRRSAQALTILPSRAVGSIAAFAVLDYREVFR